MPNDIPAGSTAVAAESEVFAAPVAAPGFRADRPLHKLSVVIPARDEEGCIGSTVEHLGQGQAGRICRSVGNGSAGHGTNWPTNPLADRTHDINITARGRGDSSNRVRIVG